MRSLRKQSIHSIASKRTQIFQQVFSSIFKSDFSGFDIENLRGMFNLFKMDVLSTRGTVN